jgi:hypothetical protein
MNQSKYLQTNIKTVLRIQELEKCVGTLTKSQNYAHICTGVLIIP